MTKFRLFSSMDEGSESECSSDDHQVDSYIAIHQNPRKRPRTSTPHTPPPIHSHSHQNSEIGHLQRTPGLFPQPVSKRDGQILRTMTPQVLSLDSLRFVNREPSAIQLLRSLYSFHVQTSASNATVAAIEQTYGM